MTRLMVSAVYQILNQSNGKCYVGSSVDVKRRWRRHLVDLRRGRHCNPHLQGAFCKHGEDVFLFSVLEQVTPEGLVGREQHYLDVLKPEYNIAPMAGSQLGFRHTSEARQKMSEAHKGKRLSAETRRRVSNGLRGEGNPMYGKHLSAEHRAKLSMALSGKRSPMYGKHLSSETRAKLSTAKMGHQTSEETRRKISQTLTGRRLTAKTRRKISKALTGICRSKAHCRKLCEAGKEYWHRVRAADGGGG